MNLKNTKLNNTPTAIKIDKIEKNILLTLLKRIHGQDT